MERNTRFQIAFFIIVRIVFNTALRIVYPFLPVFGRGLGVDLTTMSQAMALRSATGAAGPFLASIGDTRGRKIGMLLGLTLFVVANSLIFISPTFPVFVIALILTLLGYCVFNPAMQAYMGDRIPYQRRGQALALLELGWSLAFIIGVPLMGLLIARSGWKAPFQVLAVLGLLSIILMAILLPSEAARPAGQPGLWRMFGLVLASAPALAGLLMGAAASMANELVGLVFGVWLEDTFGLKIAALGIAAMVIGFSELGGELLSAGLVDRIGKARAVALGLVCNSLAVILLVLLGSGLTGALVGLFLFYLTFEFAIVCTIPLMNEILPQARATVMAIYIATITLGRAVGDVISPWLYRFGQEHPYLPALLAVGLGVAALNLVSLLALRMLAHGLQKEALSLRTDVA
jgi:MFS transporter, DHA1 family, inner membrane transport protein